MHSMDILKIINAFISNHLLPALLYSKNLKSLFKQTLLAQRTVLALLMLKILMIAMVNQAATYNIHI